MMHDLFADNSDQLIHAYLAYLKVLIGYVLQTEWLLLWQYQ